MFERMKDSLATRLVTVHLRPRSQFWIIWSGHPNRQSDPSGCPNATACRQFEEAHLRIRLSRPSLGSPSH
jgi:hypothetical protein